MIGVTRDGHVMTLEMQRAERRNALNGELVDGLRETIEKAATEDVRAIVLTGQGHVFSSGADLTDAAGVAEELPDKAKALNVAIDQAPVPVIGAINGPAIGAGVILSMICDLRVVAPDAYFQFPVAKYGLALDNWSIRRLTSLAGARRIVRQGVGFSGRGRGPAGPHRETPAEVPRGLTMMRAALRFGFGTASLLAGSWALRALHGAPAALGASPAEIEAVARRSPHFRDGSFVNVDPASGISLDREEQRKVIWDLIGSRGASRP